MKKLLSIVVLALLAVCISCTSDSSTDSLTQEEKEAKQLMNNTWKVVGHAYSFIGNSNENPMAVASIEEAFSIETYSLEPSMKKLFGMNKKGEVYSWLGYEKGGGILDFSYSCTSQKGKKFSGYFNGVSSNNRLTDIYVRQIDEDKVKIVISYDIDAVDSVIVRMETMLLQKVSPWDESITIKKIFENLGYSANHIEELDLQNYERDHGQGTCK